MMRIVRQIGLVLVALVLVVVASYSVATQGDDRLMELPSSCTATLLACSPGSDCNTTTCTRQFLDPTSGRILSVAVEDTRPPKRTWLITGPKVDGWTPATCIGVDRVDALTHCGFTVWTASEWADAKRLAGR